MENNIFIELTLTNNCNCNCRYCFEGAHVCESRNASIEQKTLELLVNACDSFDKNKYTWFTISFWGGEPFMNTEYMYKIIQSTYKYDFVRYHYYSNGTLYDKYEDFIQQDFIEQIRSRLNIQLSYDGEPHHSLMRGDTGSIVLKTAELLKKNSIDFSFKATLTYELIEKLPEIWDSYHELFLKFGNKVQYFPTLDTSKFPEDNDKTFEIWKTAIVDVAKKEYKFIQLYNMPLWQWFGSGRKMNCMLGNSIHIHNDGNIYICHGCPYIQNNSKFKLQNVNNIASLYDVINDKLNNICLPDECVECGATYCSVCHVTQLKETDDVYEKWSLCRTNNKNKCKYFKWFGYISKLLKFEILKLNKCNTGD